VRERIENFIHQARKLSAAASSQSHGQNSADSAIGEQPSSILASEAVRLARIAACLHMSQAAQLLSHAAPAEPVKAARSSPRKKSMNAAARREVRR
jgi:hypothetical protein